MKINVEKYKKVIRELHIIFVLNNGINIFVIYLLPSINLIL